MIRAFVVRIHPRSTSCRTSDMNRKGVFFQSLALCSVVLACTRLTEEGEQLLGGRDSESEEEVLTGTVSGVGGAAPIRNNSQQQDLEGPPPCYNAPHPATLAPTPFTSDVPMAAALPIPSHEAPPDYSLHAKEALPTGKAGLAVQIQIDGKLVPGTVMEDVSWRKMRR